MKRHARPILLVPILLAFGQLDEAMQRVFVDVCSRTYRAEYLALHAMRARKIEPGQYPWLTASRYAPQSVEQDVIELESLCLVAPKQRPLKEKCHQSQWNILQSITTEEDVHRLLVAL